MTERVLVMFLALAVGGLFLVAFQVYRKRWTPGPERLDVEPLGLELMEGCCAFVVFTTPSCRPCKAALSVVRTAAEKSRGLTEVREVNAMEQPELAARYSVRTIPTVFLITASGHVVHRWREVPTPGIVESALAEL